MRYLMATCAAAMLVLGAGTASAAQKDQSYRTELPKITPKRWQQAPKAIPKPRRITGQDYLNFIRKTYLKAEQSKAKVAGSPDAAHQGEFAREQAFIYKLMTDPKYAKRAMKFIRGDYAYLTEGKGKDRPTDFVMMSKAVECYHWLKGGLTPKDKALCKKWLLLLDKRYGAHEYGASNRPAGRAVGLAAINHWWPDSERHEFRAAYAEQVWNDWWKYRDNDENACGYNSHFLKYMALWVEVLGKHEEVYQDPAAKKMIYRYLAQVSPLGVMPHYGDGVGWAGSIGDWIGLFETWGTVYKDGQFRWAAHRLFEYAVEHEEQLWQWGNINYYVMNGLMTALFAADDSIEPVQPKVLCTLTTRKACRFTSREERTKTHYGVAMVEKTIPDKLLLRTGWDLDSTFAMVELNPPMGHGHLDAGSVNCLVSKGSVLLTDTPYLVKGHEFHNCFQARRNNPPDRNWGQSLEAHCRMTITPEDVATDGPNGAARIRIDNYMGEPLTLVRRVLLLGDAGLLVRDTITATGPFDGAIGPAWQTTHVYGKQGFNWANTCQATLPVAYIWDPKYLMQVTNRPWDLLVWFAPREGTKMQVGDVRTDTSGLVVKEKVLWNNFAKRVWHRSAASLKAGQSRTFTTVLMPHAPTGDATFLAKGISVPVDVPTAGVVKLTPSGGTTLWAGANDSGKLVTAGPIQTDAKWFLIRMSGNQVLTHWSAGGKTLKVNGKPLTVGP